MVLDRCPACAYPAGDGPDETDEHATGTARPSFATWLAGHRDPADPFASLADDVAADQSFPADLATWEALETYLQGAGAIQDALSTAYDAWNAYHEETTR